MSRKDPRFTYGLQAELDEGLVKPTREQEEYWAERKWEEQREQERMEEEYGQ